ncbi:MAG TPA: TolC family protein [Candidatus Acidoferrales bacterium]|nr:TolC family protein [Candidatus Acidoferrales bacterium]
MLPRFVRTAAAGVLVFATVVGPVAPASAQEQQPAQQPAQPSQQPAQAAQPAPLQGTLGSLHLRAHDFSKAPRPFPKVWQPYRPIQLEKGNLENSPRLEQMIHDGKLALTLQDAITLALENNMDIIVQRYSDWISDTDILRAKGGGISRGIPFANGQFAEGANPSQNFDPTITTGITFDDRNIPVNNPFTAGTGISSLASLVVHTATYNTQYSQGFATGTGFGAFFNNTRSSTNSPASIFNPSVQSSLGVFFNQQLLNGFGLLVNTRFIRIAKINKKIADLAFAQQAINTTNQVSNAYWELVFARENVKVQQEAVNVAEKLYADNKRQVEIGTMAPIDVVRAEAEVATNRQNLIVAQTVQLQQQTLLISTITKNPLTPQLISVEVVPTDSATQPVEMQTAPLPDAVKEALDKRPDILQQVEDLKARDINVHATRNALLPTFTVSGQYLSQGLGGDAKTLSAPTTVAGNQIVNQAGVPVIVNTPSGAIPVFLPQNVTTVTGIAPGGLGDALSSVFNNRFPDYTIQFNLNLPIRNRPAQADSARALLEQRQSEARMRQLQNNVVIDVRNTQIALEQDRARVQAAGQARILQERTLDAEQKKYQLGASTVFLVIQAQRDLSNARGVELRALVDLAKAKIDYERALGRTLDVNHITIADARRGTVEHNTLIPGTFQGEVIGTQKSY